MAAECHVTEAAGRARVGAPVLSVCIPTYNFGRFIEETLLSILTQTPPSVEVVVLDSASDDDTAAVVAGLLSTYPTLRYVRAEQRMGIDRDMARVVDLARGAYCWLFSADDVMTKGAIARVLAEIATEDDLYLCMHSNHALSMEMTDASHPVLRSAAAARFDLSDPVVQLAYFRLAESTEALFSFMGSLIVRREKWQSVALNEHFVGSCWAHVARIFELMPRGLSVNYLAAVLLGRRGDNDSFADKGVIRRYALAIDGYRRLASHFWGDRSEQAFHIQRVLRSEFPLRVLLSAKALCRDSHGAEDIELLDGLVNSLYVGAGLSGAAQRLAYRAFPVVLHRPIRALYRVTRIGRRPFN